MMATLDIANGVVVVDATAAEFPELARRFQKGYLGLQNHREEVWFKNLRIGRWREGPHEPVARHVAGEFVIVPEQPAQDFEALAVICAAEAAIALSQAEQDRRCLGKAHTIVREYGISPISFTVRRHSAVRVAPPPKSVQTGSNFCPHKVSIRASL